MTELDEEEVVILVRGHGGLISIGDLSIERNNVNVLGLKALVFPY